MAMMGKLGGPCLSEATILAFVDGKLSPEQLAELEAHIAECETCRAAVSGAAVGAASAVSTMPLAKSTPSIPSDGDMVSGKYLVKKLLGRGGMGAVLAAQHVELGSSVAIKVSFQREASSQARFLREAKLAARLSNENIARVYDVGRLSDGAPYLVMEFLRGEDLGVVLSRGPVPVETAVSWMLQACAGVREAHSKGIVHRDLKPTNLFLAKRDDGSEIIKVLDFGVSKLLHRDIDALDVSLTTTEMLVGSPAYMSPEQLRDSKDVDARADIWSLGVILYQLVTGKLPFAEKSLSALILAVADETPAPPSTVVAGIPPFIDACVARCLAKAREERFQTVQDLMNALNGEMRAVAAPPKSRAPMVALAFVAGLVVAVGVVTVWTLRHREPKIDPIHATPTESVPAVTSTPTVAATPAPSPTTTTTPAISTTIAAPSTRAPIVRTPPTASSGKHPIIKPVDPTATPE